MDIYKKVSIFGYKNYKKLMTIAFTIILFYIFNLSLTDVIFKSHIILYLLFIISIISIILANLHYITKKRINERKSLIITLLIMFLLIVIRNGDIIHSHYGLPFCSVYSLFLIMFLSLNNKWYKIFSKIFLIFIIEHIFFTFFSFCFPKIYFNNIMPLFPEYHKELLYQFNHKQIAGLTAHYSTNVIYLTIGYLFYYINLIKSFDIKSKKTKLNILILILLIISILLTGKRSQVFYLTIITIAVYIINNKNNIKEIAKKLVISFISIAVFLNILSLIIPTITNSFRRILAVINNPSVFGTRQVMYDLAIEKFHEKPIFGWGWGNYKYLYNSFMIIKERDYMNVHNIYLQLLTEVGIVGFIFICLILGYLLITISLKVFKKRNKASTIDFLFFSFHIYLLLEGILGNSIYDANLFMTYSIILGAFLSESYKRNKKRSKV